MKKLLLCSLLVSIAPYASAASYDCAKANSVAEKMVCSNPELNRFDEVLSENYHKLLESSGKKNDIEDEKVKQRNWIKTKEECSDLACLRRSYIQRNDEICEFILNSTTGPFNFVSSSTAIQTIEKELWKEAHNKPPADVVAELYQKHLKEISSLGFTDAELASGLFFSGGPGTQYQQFFTLGQYLGLMYELNGVTKISRVDDGESLGFKVKVPGQPSTGFVFHKEDDELYLNGLVQGDDIYVDPQNINISSLFYQYGVMAMAKNGAAL